MELRANVTARVWEISRIGVLIWSGAALIVGLHLALAGMYGYQRDELYFIECARHLAWGYVDQPPLIALVASVSLALFGDTLSAIRILPALAAGGLVALAAGLTLRLGGGLFAVFVTMIAVGLAPFDMATGSILTMNAFEPLIWLGLTVTVIEQIDEPRAWRWALIGAIVGLGILNKWSMAFYALSLAGGMLLSPVRRKFAVPALLGAAAIALVIAAPNIAWQAMHGWPQVTVLRNADLAKNQHVSPFMFLVMQLPLMNPFTAPLWIAGVWALIRSRRYAGIGFAYLILVTLEIVLHGKIYYTAPVYPALIAAGAVALESLTRSRRMWRIAAPVAIAAGALAIMPEATPALPLPALLVYQHAIDVRSVKIEHTPTGMLPQQFADQLGWNDLESSVAAVVDSLSPQERADAVILTHDYGQASALDFLGRRDNLPPAISGHNQFYLWGPYGNHRVIVAIGIPKSLLAREFRTIVQAGLYVSPYVLPENNHLPIYVCRDPRIPFAAFWPRLRSYV